MSDKTKYATLNATRNATWEFDTSSIDLSVHDVMLSSQGMTNNLLRTAIAKVTNRLRGDNV